MSKYFQWLILSSLTGSPLLSLLALLVIWWMADRYTFGFLPDPLKFVHRWNRGWKLKRELERNPHDRRAAVELADLHLVAKRYRKALALLRPCIEAGDEHPSTLLSMAVACLGSGHTDQGEAFLNAVDAVKPEFRLGQTQLERGRWRLARGDSKGAIEPLEMLCRTRPGSVEGKYLLARAYAAQADDVKAAYLRRDAWRDFASAPRFQRRKERFWAWRAQPHRPALMLVFIVVVGLAVSTVAGPALSRAAHASTAWSGMAADDEP